MNRNPRFLPAVLALGAALPACVVATDAAPVNKPGISTASAGVSPESVSTVRFERAVTKLAEESADAAALRAISALATQERLAEGEWRAESVSRDALGGSHVRVKQHYKGLPVWGGEVIAHGDDTRIHLVSGNVARDLGELSTTPALSEGEALRIAKADYEWTAMPGAKLVYERETVELVVFPRDGESARLAFHVEMFNELQEAREPGRPQYFIDAEDGSILKSFDSLATLSVAPSQASGPGGNGKVTRSWVNQLDVEASGAQFVLQSARQVTTNMNHGQTGTGTPVTGSLTSIGDAAIDDAHGFVELSLDALQNWFGHSSVDDHGMQILSRVHYGSNYENGYWDGARINFGDGAQTLFATSGDIDCLAHELSHGFTERHSKLEFTDQSGSLSESFGDVAGTIAEFYSEGDSADWVIGADIMKAPGGFLRDMCDPTRDGISIDNFAKYRAGMDVHYTSGIGNKAFCLAARRLSSGSPTGLATTVGVRRAGQAWYEANAHYWTPTTKYLDGCTGILDAALALGFSQTELTALSDSWRDVGVTCTPELTKTIAKAPVTKGQFVEFAPIAARPGTRFVVTMTATGDPDLYVQYGTQPTKTQYACRPYKGFDEEETCTLTVPQNVNRMYFKIDGYANGTYALSITYTPL
jgi:vibriolysin